MTRARQLGLGLLIGSTIVAVLALYLSDTCVPVKATVNGQLTEIGDKCTTYDKSRVRITIEPQYVAMYTDLIQVPQLFSEPKDKCDQSSGRLADGTFKCTLRAGESIEIKPPKTYWVEPEKGLELRDPKMQVAL